MAYQPLTLRQVAAAIREEQASPDGDPWLWVRQFIDDFYAATPEVRATLIAERPDLTGDPRFDAYLAALAEHFAIHYQLPIPRWVTSQSGFWSSGGSRRSSRACTRWQSWKAPLRSAARDFCG
jgi:hypothetical protein